MTRRHVAGLAGAFTVGFAATLAYLAHQLNRALNQIGRTT